MTETLEAIPRRWKVVQNVREKFTCRDCEKITQLPAPFHVLPRGFAGPSLLAMILFEKYGQHQPLNRQAERYARAGVELACQRWPTRSAAAASRLMPMRASTPSTHPIVTRVRSSKGPAGRMRGASSSCSLTSP